MHRNTLWAIVAISVLGMIDAGYLTYEHYAGTIPPCTISGCEVVLTSTYATLWGIPISLLGLFFYISVFCAALYGTCRAYRLVRIYLLGATGAGFFFSTYLFYLQAQVLNAFCQYCLISFGSATLLFIFSLLLLKKESRSVIL